MFDTHGPVTATPRSPARDLLEANCRLETRVAELLAVQDLTRAITAELDIDRVLETCLGAVAEAIAARSVSILLASEVEGSLVVWARHGRDRRYLVGERRALGEGIAGWVAAHRVPLLVRALEEQPAFQEAARADGYQSGTFVAVPLELRGRLLGVLGATEKAGGQAFDERDLRLLLALTAPIAAAVENARLFEAVQQSSVGALAGLVESLEGRQGVFRGHGRRVAEYAARAAHELGVSSAEVRTLRRAALLHDIGTVTLPDELLHRAGPLTDEELALVREHPARGERLVEDLSFMGAARPLIRHHHERWDGQGYPDGRRGRDTDPLARILALAETFDAMTSPRPYRPARSWDAALAELSALAGSQFDPDFVEPFARAVAGLRRDAGASGGGRER
jgi:HD-GYP domain-containing protein (c-di-GMP phosphodiesterase class II)